MEEKKIKQFFNNVIYLSCWQDHLKHFLENYRLTRESGNDAYSRGRKGAWGSCYLRYFDVLRTNM